MHSYFSRVQSMLRIDMIKKSYAWGFLLLALFAFLNPSDANAKELKVGFIYLSSAQDGGWTYSHDLGRQSIEKIPGVTTTFVESISQVESVYIDAVLHHMAQNKYDLIFATGYGYLDAVLKIAPQFPNIVFMHCSGHLLTGGNIGTYFGRMYEARYLAGLVAGEMTRSNIIGYVAAYPVQEVIRGINAFARGVLESNPAAKVYVRWTKDWHSPIKEKQITNELIDLKADVITQHQDSPAAQIIAEKRGVYSIGYNHDMSSFAPKGQLTAPVWNWAKVYSYVVQRVAAGKWKSENILWGLKEGLVDIAPLGTMVPEKLRQKVLRRKKEIVVNKFSVFTGPLWDQEGNIRIPKGRQATDEELRAMNWFLKGVVGTTNPR